MEPIVIYCISRTMADLPPGQDWLSADESARASRLHVPKRRNDWLLGRWTAKQAVRLVLAQEGALAPGPGLIEIRSAPDGAPEVFLGGGRAPLSLALSHSGGRGFCAVTAPGVPLGCDTESIQPRSQEFILDYLAEGERALVAEAPEDAKPLLATLLWSAKESALKCLREGLRRDTRSVPVQLEGGDGSEWTALSVRCLESSRLFYGWWRCADGFVQTIAAGSRSRPPLAL